jgi:hypothetical protein
MHPLNYQYKHSINTNTLVPTDDADDHGNLLTAKK